MNLETSQPYLEKPAPFTPDEPLFWDDFHISKQMLATHLNPDIDLASRRSETIDRSVNWLIETLNLQPGAVVFDLGCGPGERQIFVARGFAMANTNNARTTNFTGLSGQGLSCDFHHSSG